MRTLETKAEKMIRAAESALKIIAYDGLDKLSYTRVAEDCGISRAWLYKYIGRSPLALSEFAVDHYGKFFAELDNRNSTSTPSDFLEGVLRGTRQLLADTEKYPWLIMIYYRYANTPTPIGECIHRIETAYRRQFVAEIRKALGAPTPRAEVIAELLTALRLGMSHRWFAPGGSAILSRQALLDEVLGNALRALIK